MPLFFSNGYLQLINVTLRRDYQKPLVKTDFAIVQCANEGSTSIRDSNFQDSLVSVTSHFLCDGSLNAVQVKGCSFENITWGISREKCVQKRIVDGLIQDCSFSFVSNGIDGVLFPTQGIRSMKVSNSTFSKCNGNCPIGRMTYSTGLIEVFDCPLISVNSSSEQFGGALYISGDAKLSVMRCFFNCCQVGASNNSGIGSGGAITVNSTILSSVVDSNFSNCVSGYTGAACYSQSSKFQGCVFWNGSSQHYGCILFHCTIKGADLIECRFLSSKVLNYGGAMSHSPRLSTTFFVTNCLFKGNRAGTRSGAVHCWGSEQSPEAFWKFCFLEDNAALEYCNGIDFVFSYSADVQQRNFIETYSFNVQKPILFIVRNDTGDKSEWIPSPTQYNETFISAEYGNDEFEMCGHASRECKTLGHVFEKLGDAFRKSPIFVKRGEYVEKVLNVGTKRIRIIGESQSNTVIKMKSAASGNDLFIVDGGLLDITSFTLIPQASASSISSTVFFVIKGYCSVGQCIFTNPQTINGVLNLFSSVVKVIDGKMILSECILKDMEFDGSPCLSFSNTADFLFNSSCFLNIIRRNGNGGIVETELQSSQNLLLNNISFMECQLLNGNGGGVCVTLNSDCILKIGSLTEVSLDSCSVQTDASLKGKGGGLFLKLNPGSENFELNKLVLGNGNKAWKGKSIFLDAESLSAVADYSHFVSCISLDRSKEEEIMGFNGDHEGYAVPLLFYFQKSFAGPAFVGGTNNLNFDQCGYSGYPCSTLEKAVQLRFEGSPREIVVNEGFEWKEVVEMKSYEWRVRTMVKGRNVKVLPARDATERGMVIVSKRSSITNISFALCSALSETSHTFIVCLSNELEIVDCSVTPLSNSANFSLGYSFIVGIGGRIKIHSFMQNGLFVSDQTALFKIEESCSLECVWCTFGGIKRKNGNGGLLEVRGGEATRGGGRRMLLIDECEFGDCCVEEEGCCGGGIYFELMAEDSFVVNGSSIFEGCKTSTSVTNGGKGGGMIILLNDITGIFLIGDAVKFSKENPNDAICGKDIFVQCGDGILLKDKISSSSFGFFEDSGAQLEVLSHSGSEKGEEELIIPLAVYLCALPSPVIVDGSSGVDHSHCGFSYFPCYSMDYCAKERLTRNINQMKFTASSTLCGEVTFSDFSVIVNSTSDDVSVAIRDERSCILSSLIECSIDVSISKLGFKLPYLMQESHISFISSTVKLELSNCSFSFPTISSDTSINFCVIEVKEGDADLSEITICEDITFDASSFIVVESAHECTIGNGSFSGMKQENGNGGCIKIKRCLGSQASICVDNCSISSSCIKGNGLRGGGIMVSLMSHSVLSVEKSNFSACAVPVFEADENGKGLGGGAFIEVDDIESSMELRDVQFEFCSAWKGNNVFIFGNTLSEIVTSNSFIFDQSGMEENDLMGFERSTTKEDLFIPLELYFREFGKEGFVGGEMDEGYDHSGCGFADYPCQTIHFLLSLRYSENSMCANIKLLPSFVFTDALILESQEMIFKVEINGRNIFVNEEGTTVGGGLIETREKITFEGIEFIVPFFFSNVQRKSLFLCANGILTLIDSSLKAASGSLAYSFVIIQGGKIVMQNVQISLIDFGDVVVVELSGTGVYGVFDGVEMENIRKDGTEGLIRISDGASLEVFNSKAAGPQQFSNHGVIEIDALSSLSVSSTNFSLLTRNAGSGAAVCGTIGRGKKIEMRECNISSISCLASEARGGSVLASLNEGGALIFENNTVQMCKVNKTDGLGGGLHLTFASAEVEYSMRGNTFKDNDGYLGYDVYLVCPTPRLAVDKNKWVGSVEEGQDNKTLWAIDPEFPLGNDTMMKYLFGQPDSIIYVNTERGLKEGCGAEDLPCIELSYGFGKMVGEKNSLVVISLCELKGEINREMEPMTISGSGENGSDVIVNKEGHLVMTVGTRLSRISIDRIKFLLPEESLYDELMKIGVGTVYFVSCVFGGSADSSTQTSIMIVNGCDGFVQFDNATVQNTKFVNGNGVASMKRGSIALIEVKIENVSATGNILKCNEVMRMEIKSNCGFENCSSQDDGGALKCSLSEGGEMIIADATILKCSTKKNDGKGGGIFMSVVNESTSDYILRNLTFALNEASEGKDVFLNSYDLNLTVTNNRFVTNLVDETGAVIVNMKGIDAVRFNEGIDLLWLLIKRESDSVEISEDGFDILGCGEHEHPCNTFWRGFENVKAESPIKKIEVSGLCVINDSYDLSRFSVKSAEEEKPTILRFESGVDGSSGDAILVNKESLNVEWISFDFSISFSSKKSDIILTEGENSILRIWNCSFKNTERIKLVQTVVHSSGGYVEVKDVKVNNFESSIAPFHFTSSCEIVKCTFEDMSSEEEEAKGGVIRIELKNEEACIVKDVQTRKCECSKENGKGGWMFMDCSLSSVEHPFLFNNVSFLVNNATFGKNMFIESFNLNTTVTLETFLFAMDELKDDGNLLVGSDDVFEKADLFRFLVEYLNESIYVSSKGHDVMRCGSIEDPCMTMWKGLKHIIAEGDRREKMIVVINRVLFQDSYDLSGFALESSEIDETEGGDKEDSKSIVDVTNNAGERSLVTVRNKQSFRMKQITLSIAEGFENDEKCVIMNEDGSLRIEDCVFETKGTVENCGDYSFVIVKQGELVANKLELHQGNVKRSIIQLCTGCGCSVDAFVVEWTTISDGCVICVIDRNLSNSAKNTLIQINGSSFSSLSTNGPNPCVVESNSFCCVEASLNETRMEMSKASNCQKGGVVFMRLHSRGKLTMKQCEVVQCGCDFEEGRGGGAYIATEESGEMDFLFQSTIFKGNNAKIGNDIYVECVSIFDQINETQFRMDLREESFNRKNAIWGIDMVADSPVDLMFYITVHQADTIIVSSASGKGGSNERQCGSRDLPCLSLDYGLSHLTCDLDSRILVDTEGLIANEMELREVTVSSKSGNGCEVKFVSDIEKTEESLIQVFGNVQVSRVKFLFDTDFSSIHRCLFSMEGEQLIFISCAFSVKTADRSNGGILPLELVQVKEGCLTISEMEIKNMSFESNAILRICENSKEVKLVKLMIGDILLNSGCVILKESANILKNDLELTNGLQLMLSNFSNITSVIECPKCIEICASNQLMSIKNCSFVRCASKSEIGKIMRGERCTNISLESCLFDGETSEAEMEINTMDASEICKWNSSVIDLMNSNSLMKDNMMANASLGALTIRGGNCIIEKGEFNNNNPRIELFPSARRNILCEKEGKLNIESLKGGDGMERNASLWILNDGCELSGIVLERASEFFIPTLEAVEMKEVGDSIELTFRGTVLLPCNLQFQIVSRIGEVSSIETHAFSDEDFVSEVEVHGRIGSSLINSGGDEVEVSAHILFGKSNSPSSTESFILKNRSESEPKGDENVVEGGKKEGSTWPIIVIAMGVILFLVLVIAVISTVRWKKAKNEAEDLREIVNDNIRKDPKAFEMVTMEMSPEEQWRRAEREAEKNEERFKKRVYDTNMQHSESSEHLLSESGSTEYILGRDSDKIPQWMLEKVDEKEDEETRKRSPSPSISSTCSTDSDSTFVRGEDLCPTTSSMSNLVDAMACSSPHEKLIVDLRDSLFMLLHGKNEKKEMEIGTLQEREQTAAQILFWVANGALHSFEEEEMPLQSLANLSPHIVLFSEHMVICIAMHSDCSSSDSDSSSISSSTIVTSSSDCSRRSKRYTHSPPPSSAFEDDDDLRKECLRWKAPELMNGAKQHATKKTAVFSIGMMLWECLTLQIPFGEYEAVVAGQKIVNGERPAIGAELLGCFNDAVAGCLSPGWQSRPTLVDLKREFIQRFPAGSVMLTVSDAIDVAGGAGRGNFSRIVSSGSSNGSESWFS